MKPVRVLGLVCALLACARSSPAQQSVDLASIGGRVVDPTGAVVRGAEVTARHVDTNVTAKAATDAEGRFRFPYLKIGSYIVTVRQPGFRDAVQSLTLSAGAAFELPISLAVGGVDADVTVTAGTTVLEAARSQIAGDRPGTRGAQPADERPQLPRRSRCSCPACRRPTSPARSCSPRRRRCPASDSRSAASATSRTASSSTASRPTTMRRH